MKQLLFTFSLAILAMTSQAFAQMWGGAPPVSVAQDPYASYYGSGIIPANQPCAYGGQRATELEDDPYSDYRDQLRDASDRIKEVREDLSDNRQDVRDARNALNDVKRSLRASLDHMTETDFIDVAVSCEAVLSQGCSGGSGGEPPGQPPSGTEEGQSKPVDPCQSQLEKTFPKNVRSQAQCSRAINYTKQQGGSHLKAEGLCISGGQEPDLAGELGPGVNVKANKLNQCQSAARKLMDAKSKFDTATAEQERIKSDESEARSDARQIKRQVMRDMREDAKDRREFGDWSTADDAGVRCATCARHQRGYTRVDHTGDYVNLGLGVGSILANVLVNQLNARRNAQLGYPTGPNPYAAIGYGMPFLYGGLYGAAYGGMAGGGFGCAPGIGGPGGYANYPLGYPYGGGMYTPGVAPWGINGPWGAQMPYGGLNLNAGLNMGGYPFGMMGGAGPFAGSPFLSMGGQFGNPFGMGGFSPYGFNGQGGFGSNQFGMGGFNNSYAMQYAQAMDQYSRNMQLFTYTAGQASQLTGLANSYFPGMPPSAPYGGLMGSQSMFGVPPYMYGGVPGISAGLNINGGFSLGGGPYTLGAGVPFIPGGPVVQSTR